MLSYATTPTNKLEKDLLGEDSRKKYRPYLTTAIFYGVGYGLGTGLKYGIEALEKNFTSKPQVKTVK